VRINWFSPLPPARTGIAVWAAGVLPYFAAEHELRLFTSEAKIDPAIEKFGKIIRYNPAAPPWRDLNSADLTLYHIGNNSDFHTHIRKMAQLHPGIVVLHDLRLHDFVWMTYVHPEGKCEAYLEAMGRWYGDDGVRAARAFISGGHIDRENADRMAQLFPLTREIVDGSLGVITHTKSGLDAMGETPDCPAAALKFPYASMPEEEYRKIADARLGRHAPYRILIFGYIQRNRRLGPILEALAGLPERDQFRIEICGEVWDKAGVAAIIDRLGLTDLVQLRGFLPDKDVPGAFAEADIALNLRYPTMGEASLSQMEFWDYGLPALVTRTGWYASLPEEAVCFVDPEREIEDIQGRLRNFLADPQRYRCKGEAGRRALQGHDPREYVMQTVDFARQAAAAAPRAAGFQLATRAGSEMRRWLHRDMSGYMLDKAASEIRDLFSGGDTPAGKP
jgi:glycosyltransferase involved in cell wall biosynthesis